MKYEVDTYKLEYNENTNKYYISFHDSVGKECEIETEKEIFDVYMKSKQEYKKIKNQYDRHEEHSEQTENNLHQKTSINRKSFEDIIINKLMYSDLRKVVRELPIPHNKRLEMYLFKELTVQEIALKENRKERTIRYSISKGISEIVKKMKNY